MSNDPHWLPEALCYSDFKGGWDNFLATIYDIFERDFKHSKPSYDNRPVIYNATIEDGKEATFWHITSSIDFHTKERVPDLRRCERVPWPKPIIEHSTDQALSVWKNRRHRKIRVLVWLERRDYLVVLEELSQVMMLVTAYCTDRTHTRNKLIKERDLYLEMQKPPM